MKKIFGILFTPVLVVSLGLVATMQVADDEADLQKVGFVFLGW